MTSVAIRQSGGANIVSLPKAIVKTLGLDTGSKLELSINDGQIILTPMKEKETLESLLEGSPKEFFKVSEVENMDIQPAGREEF